MVTLANRGIPLIPATPATHPPPGTVDIQGDQVTVAYRDTPLFPVTLDTVRSRAIRGTVD